MERSDSKVSPTDGTGTEINLDRKGTNDVIPRFFRTEPVIRDNVNGSKRKKRFRKRTRTERRPLFDGT